MIGIQHNGAGEFLKLATDAKKLDNAIKAEIRKVTKEGRETAAARLAQAGTGRTYEAAKNARRARFFSKARRIPTYTASAPGRPPAKASGNLLASVRSKFPRADKGYGAKVFANRGPAFYRHFLEFGARPAKRGKRIGAGGTRAPRPIWTPLQREFEGKLVQAMQRAVDRFGSHP
jgi:hypothetical protein